MDMNNRLLCILIPSYNYFDGVQRILNLVKSDNRISVVISDDSDDPRCAKKINNLVKNINLDRIKYVIGPGKGAGENWNSLYKYIDAKYYTFMHHDEVYSDLLFVDKLKNKSKLDCVILPCWVVHSDGIRKIPSKCQKATMMVAKKFLPIFNFIGPSSSIILKKSITPKFNLNLKWYIDVEWFFRALKLCSHKIVFESSSTVVVSYQYENSITNMSIDSIAELECKEKRFLFKNGYKWTIVNWYIYGAIISKFTYYSFSFYSYCSFYAKIFISRAIKLLSRHQ